MVTLEMEFSVGLREGQSPRQVKIAPQKVGVGATMYLYLMQYVILTMQTIKNLLRSLAIVLTCACTTYIYSLNKPFDIANTKQEFYLMKNISVQDQIKNHTLNICFILADNATNYGDIADHFRSIGILCADNAFSLDQLQTVVSDLQATVNLAMDQDIARRVADNQCPIESKAICKSAYQGRLSDQIKKYLIPAHNETLCELHGEQAKIAHFYRSDAGAAKVQANPPKAKAKKTITADGTATRLPAQKSPQVDTVQAIKQVETGYTQLPQDTIFAALRAGLQDGTYSLSALISLVDSHVAQLDSERVTRELKAIEADIAASEQKAA